MRNGTVKATLVAILALIWTASLAAQQIYFPNFTSLTNLQSNGSQLGTYNGNSVLRVTSGYPGFGAPHAEASTTYFTKQQPVNAGFTTYFQFQIHSAYAQLGTTPGDGVAFLIQNAAAADATYGATGSGITARGVTNGGLGYAGIPNSLAIEFDTYANTWDPTLHGNNHVAVQSCGPNTNGPVHTAGIYTIGTNNNVTKCLVNSGLDNSATLPTLGVTCGPSSCVDGAVHTVVIEYTQVGNVWTLLVYIDQPLIPTTHTPCPNASVGGCTKAAVAAINIPYNIDWNVNSVNGLKLATDPASGNYGFAWVGFSGSQTNQPQQQDILAWEFTPHTSTSVTQTLQGCAAPNTNCIPPVNDFNFGAHDTKVTEYQGYYNATGIQMTVIATPWPRSVFHQQRLMGTNFSGEQCIAYLGAGTNTCIVYSVICEDAVGNPIACPTSPPNLCPGNGSSNPYCLQFQTSYYTTDPVNAGNADYLKADPPLSNSNCWASFYLSYLPQVFDSRTTGTGPTGSDQVATFKIGAQPPPQPPPPQCGP